MNEVSSVMRVKDVVVQDGGCFFRCANKKGFNKNTNIPEGSVAGLNSIVGWGNCQDTAFHMAFKQKKCSQMMPNEPNTTIGKIHCKALKTCNIQTCQKSIDVT